jgi:hypothetical protein
MVRDMREHITRILGVILLVIAALTHKHIGAGSVALLVVDGLIMLIASTKLAKKEFNFFINSFKQLDKRFVIIAFFDILFIGVFFMLIPLFSKLFMSNIGQAASVKSLVYLLIMLIAYLLTITIILLAAYSFSRGIIWLTILKKKPSAHFFKRFVLLNFLWWLILIIPVLIFAGTKSEYFMYLIIFFIMVYVHFTTFIYYDFTKNMRIGRALKNAFKFTYANFRKFVLPYAYIMGVYFILLQVFWIIPQTEKFMFFASILFVVFFLAWFRLYMSQTLKRIKEP